MPQNLRSGERGDATAAYNRGPGVLGSGRGKRQHGLVGATIKARCQLLEKKKKTHLLSSICKSTKNRAGCLWPDGWCYSGPLCANPNRSKTPAKVLRNFHLRHAFWDYCKEGQEPATLPANFLSRLYSPTVVNTVSMSVFVVYQTPCLEILTGPSVNLTSPKNTYKKIQTCLNQAFTCSTMASTLGDWWW